MNNCKGLCHKYKVLRPVGIGGQHVGHYIVGNKRSVCNEFLRYNGSFCPCCYSA